MCEGHRFAGGKHSGSRQRARTHRSLPLLFAAPTGPPRAVQGHGRFSRVLLGTRRADGARFAVKVINKAKLGEAERELLRTEIAILRLVHHPHIVRLEDVYEGAGDDGNMYIVTGERRRHASRVPHSLAHTRTHARTHGEGWCPSEWWFRPATSLPILHAAPCPAPPPGQRSAAELLEGGELFAALVGRARFSEVEARDLIKPLIDSVAYLHALGIVHRWVGAGRQAARACAGVD